MEIPSSSKLIASIDISMPQLSELAFSPDGNMLAIGTADDRLRVLDCNAGLATLAEASWSVQRDSIHWSPDGRWLATTDPGNRLVLLDVAEEFVQRSVVAWGGIELLAWNDDGSMLLASTAGYELRLLLSDDDFRLHRKFGPLTVLPEAVGFSNGGKFIHSFDGDGLLRIFSIQTGLHVYSRMTAAAEINTNHRGLNPLPAEGVLQLALSNCTRRVAILRDSGQLNLYGLPT